MYGSSRAAGSLNRRAQHVRKCGARDEGRPVLPPGSSMTSQLLLSGGNPPGCLRQIRGDHDVGSVREPQVQRNLAVRQCGPDRAGNHPCADARQAEVDRCRPVVVRRQRTHNDDEPAGLGVEQDRGRPDEDAGVLEILRTARYPDRILGPRLLFMSEHPGSFLTSTCTIDNTDWAKCNVATSAR